MGRRLLKAKDQKTEGTPIRHLRPCKAEAYLCPRVRKSVEGLFHGWGSDFMEVGRGPGNFTVALVEANDGQMYVCLPETVRFLDRTAE